MARRLPLEPSEIVLACADYGLLLEDLRWSSWTDAGATGLGTLVYNDCQPDWAQGHHHDVPDTQVTLTAPLRAADGAPRVVPPPTESRSPRLRHRSPRRAPFPLTHPAHLGRSISGAGHFRPPRSLVGEPSAGAPTGNDHRGDVGAAG